MNSKVFLFLFFIFSPTIGSLVDECIRCSVGYNVFFKNLYPFSPNRTLCLDRFTKPDWYNIVLEKACNTDDCFELMDRPPRQVIPREQLLCRYEEVFKGEYYEQFPKDHDITYGYYSPIPVNDDSGTSGSVETW